MNLGNFFKLLNRHKYTLILIPILAAGLTYYFLKDQPNSYTSETQIATGLVDNSQQAIGGAAGPQADQVGQDFDNLIEVIKSKKIVERVSYQLLIHDLSATFPYKKPSKLMLQLNADARKHALMVLNDCYNNYKELSLFDPDQNGINSLLISMGYDVESILKTLNVYRAQASDFIDMDFTAENPQMTAFVVNDLTDEFINNYTSVAKENRDKAIKFLAGLVQAKKDSLDKKTNLLKAYKIENQILDLPEQSQAIYTQIADFQTHLSQAQRDAIATAGAIKNIDSHFKPTQGRYIESLNVSVNQSIIGITDQLKVLNEKYVESNFDVSYKIKIDSLQHIMSEKIGQASDKTVNNPLANQQGLAAERLTLQVQYDLAKNSIGFIQSAIVKLQDELNRIVPHEAALQQFQNDIDVANKEYLDILNKYNQASLESNYTNQLKQVEVAMPGVAAASKKMLLVALAFLVSLGLYIIILFIVFFFDNTVKTQDELANKTGVPVLGYLNWLKGPTIDLRKVWSDAKGDAKSETKADAKSNEETGKFKNLMQSIRFEVDSELNGDKLLIVNSLIPSEGKTFLTTNLAYAYSQVNKKVLLIDGNFSNPGISKSVKSKLFIEDYLAGTSPALTEQNLAKITVLSNRGADGSLLEFANEQTIKQKLDKLKDAFDIIIIETSALDTLNKSKEWNKFADKILTVFTAGKNITGKQEADIDYLKNLDGKFMGWVLNNNKLGKVIEGAKRG